MRKSLIVALLLLCNNSWAGYAELASPAGWSTTPGATGFYRASANDVSFTNGIRGSSAVINVGGQSVKMPAAYRFSSNAGRFAARALFGSPALLGVVAVTWLAEECISYSAGSFVRTCGPGVAPLSDGYEYAAGNVSTWSPTYQQACAAGWAAAPYLESSTHKYVPTTMYAWTCDANYVQKSNNQVLSVVSNALNRRFQACPSGSYVTPAGCSVTAPPVQVGQEELESTMSPKPIPPGLPQTLPAPLPVELPIINPTPARVPYSPSDPSPTPQPMRVPQGDPQPVPDTSPQKWRQPATDIIPAPRPDMPWRVDIQPRDIIKDTPEPLPDSSPVPVTPPVGTTVTQAIPDLCASNPHILACQKAKLGDPPDPVKVENENKPLAINKDSGWGASGGSCPPPRTMSVHGMALAMPFDLLCQFANGIRPIVIGLAWLGAALTFFGFSRKN